jgi:protein involved in polysaccharide export with SLBB domain
MSKGWSEQMNKSWINKRASGIRRFWLNSFQFAPIAIAGVLLSLPLYSIAQDNQWNQNLPSNQSRQSGQSSQSNQKPSNIGRGPEPSELTSENLSRVGASAAQLRTIFAKDPGLLVELKRWMAKEAGEYGQIVDDASLTDLAVFERLERDATFRSIATRLVQKYGYLLPTINPTSDMAKEQDLIIKERAHRMVQAEEKEDALRQAEIDRISNGEFEEEEEGRIPRQDCDRLNQDPVNRRACRQLTSAPRLQRNPYRNEMSVPQTDSPDFQAPYIPYRTPRAQIQTTRAEEDSSGLGGGGAGFSRLMASLTDPMASGGSAPGFPTGAGMDGYELGASRVASGAMSMLSGSNGNNVESFATRPPMPHDIIRRTGELEARYEDADLTSPSMTHKRSPYSDIPSLYDLYVQASAKSAKVERFGLDVFRQGTRDLDAVPMDLPAGPDYVVGPGDGLTINLWGGVSQRLTRTVDREGRIALPEVGPLLVSGRSLGEVQATVQQVLRTQYRDTSADISLSRLRTVRVYVVGDVAEPGAYDISSLSTPLNALLEAGGVTSRGSLRRLKHYRGKQLIEEVDAYDLLLRGVRTDISHLENGDSLVVPPAGSLVAVSGMVRRPAIYELNGEASLQDVLELAGGILPAAALKHIEVQRLEEHQKRTMLDLGLPESDTPQAIESELTSFKIKDGDEIHIFPIASYNETAVYLQGHVLRPGKYSYREGMKLTDLISSYSELLPEPSGRYAEIIRLNAPDFRPSVESFDLAAALKDPASSPKLQPLDTVRIFSRFDFDPPPNVWVGGDVQKPGLYRTSGQIRLRDAVYLAGGLSPDADLKTAQLFRTEADGSMRIFSVDLAGAMAGESSENILVFPRDRLLIHRNLSKVDPPSVTIKGEVARPGKFPLTSNMRVQDLVNTAGGLKRSADPQQADLTHYAVGNSPSVSESTSIELSSALNGDTTANVQLRSGDVLTIRQAPGWHDIGATVAVRGEVQHPGSYGIQPGETLSSVLERAGGFSSHAFPYGALLSRQEVKQVEVQSRIELVERLKAEQVSLKSLPENDEDQKNAKLTAIAQTETTLTQLQSTSPSGRVVIHISPDTKQWAGTSSDISLRDGDTLTIPKKAEYVMISGQVYNPIAVGYRSGHSARWYLSQAGGLTPLADKKAVFVVRADGSVIASKNNSSGWFSGDPLGATLRPGDSIVVPERVPKVGNKSWTNTLQTAQLLSSIAVAIAYIHP